MCASSLQVFVANPNKPQAIVDILTNNREKLLKYLEDFHTDRGEWRGSSWCAFWVAAVQQQQLVW
jgi:hypothetical protein